MAQCIRGCTGMPTLDIKFYKAEMEITDGLNTISRQGNKNNKPLSTVYSRQTSPR